MLIPLTDSTSIYVVMMLELIKDHYARATAVPSLPAPPAKSRWRGVRTFIWRAPAGRGHVPATTSL